MICTEMCKTTPTRFRDSPSIFLLPLPECTTVGATLYLRISEPGRDIFTQLCRFELVSVIVSGKSPLPLVADDAREYEAGVHADPHVHVDVVLAPHVLQSDTDNHDLQSTIGYIS